MQPNADAEIEGDAGCGILTIDLGAIRANYAALRARAGASRCAAVVKADAYGLGAAQVAPALRRAGCDVFFVAHLDEGIALRAALGGGATVAVLHGPPPKAEPAFTAHDLTPVLNSPEQIAAWRAHAAFRRTRLAAFLHIDTGMSRLGLSATQVAAAAADPDAMRGIDVTLVMSHLACADQPEHPANTEQLVRFQALRRLLPPAPASLSASSGIFLGAAFHLDLVRPGAAVYGIAPHRARGNPTRAVVRLQGRVAQLRDIPAGAAIGYGATLRAARPMRLATVAVGYGDGLPRSLGNRGAAWLDHHRLPIVGRVSMDSLTLDATGAPVGLGALVDLIGPRNRLDDVAADAGTIGYEILTALGARYRRRYVDERPHPGTLPAGEGADSPDVREAVG